jgi:photosystem II stability/assembly factor-like uncharacterized protein
MRIRTAAIALLATVAVAGCSEVQPRAVPAPVPVAAGTPPPPIWLETPQMTSPDTGWTLRWIKWGINASELVRTTDGGRTWTDVTPPAAAALLSLPDALAPVLLARDGEHAWLALCCAGQTDTSAGMATEVFSTSDGGRTWTESELRGPAYGGPASLSFTGPDNGWLLFTMDPAGPARFGELYRTDDGGRHWTLLAADVPASCDDPSLTVATTSAGWIACEPPGPLLVSRDGGTHWAPQPLPRSARGIPQFTGPTGFMTASPASGLYLLVTHDLGRTWRRVPLPPSIGSSPDVRFLSAADGIVKPDVSPGSPVPVAYLTVNGGRTWTAVPQGLHATHPELLGYDFVSTRIWFAWYGNQAGALSPPPAPAQALASTIYQTDNSGRTWTAITART